MRASVGAGKNKSDKPSAFLSMQKRFTPLYTFTTKSLEKKW